MKRETTGLLLPILTALLAAGAWSGLAVAETVGFEDENVGGGLGPQEYWNGSDGSGGFASGSLGFNNDYSTSWSSWTGWSYSNTTDTTTPGYGNQYSAYAGNGEGNSATYGVAYNGLVGDARITIPAGYCVASAMIANTTYAALSMTDGDAFSKKFGGETENDEDWFLLTVMGKDAFGEGTGFKEFYLADYRFADNSSDYIVSDWTGVDLSSLKGASTLEFSLTSTDVGAWGMNTPAYFAMDNIVLEHVPEPSTVVMLLSAAAALLLVRRRQSARTTNNERRTTIC